jgi:hypothetical protein
MTGTGGFQTQVGPTPAPAVEGDFASQNPYFTFDAGPGGLVAGAAGCTVGRFAWAFAPLDADGTGMIALTSGGNGPVAGFVHRAQQALITTFLDFKGMIIPSGYPVTLMTGGDFWVKNNSTASAVPGQKAYADLSDGSVSFAATGSATIGAAGTGAIVTQSGTITGSISGNLLLVTGSGVLPLVAGALITGAGIPGGTKIVSQVSGSVAGAVGTYALNIGELSVPIETMTFSYGLMTILSVTSGAFEVGDAVSGTSLTVGTVTRITQLGSGTGGAGTYYVDPSQTAGTATMNAVANVETKWVAMSGGKAGELVKISDHLLG